MKQLCLFLASVFAVSAVAAEQPKIPTRATITGRVAVVERDSTIGIIPDNDKDNQDGIVIYYKPGMKIVSGDRELRFQDLKVNDRVVLDYAPGSPTDLVIRVEPSKAPEGKP